MSSKLTQLSCCTMALVMIVSCLTESPAQAQSPESESIASAAKEIFRWRCFECHGGSKTNADLSILSRDSLVDTHKVVVPGEPGKSRLYNAITATGESRMPTLELPPLTSEEISLVRKWIKIGAPEFPADVTLPAGRGPGKESRSPTFGEEYVMQSILNYLKKIPVSKRRYVRFFSTNHALTGGATRGELRLNQQALAKAINHLSMQPDLVLPETVDPETGTIFAVDIRQLGWHQTPYQSVNADGSRRPSRINLFDLVLMEYPYAKTYQDSESYDRIVQEYLTLAQMIRPVVHVRVDWFISVAMRSPLYEDLLQLPRRRDELEAMLGVDSASNLNSNRAQRAGMTVSGVSSNNRVLERHPSKFGAYWKSYNFTSSSGPNNIFVDPVNLRESLGEIMFNLPNGLHGYMITDALGRRISESPTSIVTDKFARDKVVRSGLSCVRCHDRGIKSFPENVRPAVQALADSPGFSRRRVLDLYPAKSEMNAFLSTDTKRFHRSMTNLISEQDTHTEPLTPISRRFLDSPIQLARASAELGLDKPEGLSPVFRTPQFATLGLAALASGGAIRRDMWEDYYDRVVRQLGLGVPVVPLDGLTKPDYLSNALQADVVLRCNNANNTYSPGDSLVVFVENRSSENLYIEVVGTSIDSRKVILAPSSTLLRAGETYRHPPTGHITVKPKLGKENITIYASRREFSPGVVLRANNMSDRFMHPFYPLRNPNATVQDSFDPSNIIKKTIAIETR